MSNQQVADLRHELKQTRRKWLDETEEHEAAVLKLRYKSEQLMSRPVQAARGCMHDIQQVLSASHGNCNRPFSDPQENYPNTSPTQVSPQKVLNHTPV